MSFTADIRADSLKNRLYLRLAGMMSDADAKLVAEKILSELPKLKPGFAVINDISELKPASEAASEQLKRAQAASVKAGIKRVIRVMGKQSTITNMQWNRTLRDTQGINAEVVGSLEEAERLLDGK
jgi:hypothetical protein